MMILQKRNELKHPYIEGTYTYLFCRHNNGHITRPQFRQCLTILELTCTEAEMAALEARFCNDTGFNYMAFLVELQPQEPIEMMYTKRQGQIRATNQKGRLPEGKIGRDLESILLKIKTKVFTHVIIICTYKTIKIILGFIIQSSDYTVDH